MLVVALAALLTHSSPPPPEDFTNIHVVDRAQAPTVVPGVDLRAQRAFRRGIRLALENPPDYDAALGEFRAAVRFDPHFAEAHLNIAAIYRVRRETGEADAAVEAARRASPRSDRVAAFSANLRAALLLARGDIDAADAIVQDLLRSYPHDVTALNTRALILLRSGKLEMAKWILEQKVLTLDRASIEGHTNLGQVYLRMAKLPKAVAHLKHAAGLDPKNVTARVNLGAIELDFLNYAEALKRFDEVLKLQPKRVEAVIGRASAIFGMGDRAEAIEGYRAALALDPARAALILRIGRMYQRSGGDEDLRTAVTWFKRYIRARGLPETDPLVTETATIEEFLAGSR